MLTIVCGIFGYISIFLHTIISQNIMSEILIKFGERVRQLRKEKRMSQEELADKANLHRTYIGMIERAEKM